MLNKRLVFLLVAVIMVLSFAAGCSQQAPAPQETGPATQDEKPPEDSKPADDGDKAGDKNPVSLQVSIVETDFIDAWEDQIKPSFEDEYPWITLEAVSLGEDKLDYHQTHAAAKDLPPVMQTDVAEFYHNLVDEGILLDLSVYDVANDIPQSYKEAYTHNGVLFGLTQGAAFDALYLNMQILEEAGWTEPPKNWDEFIACSKDIKEKTDKAVLTVAGDKNTTAWMPFESILLNVIGDELGEGGYEELIRSGELVLTDYPLVAERLGQLAPYMMTGSASNSEDAVTAVMTDGTCAMAIAGNWTANNIIAGIAEATGDESYAKMVLIPFNDPGKPLWLAATPESSFGVSKVDDPDLEEARDLFFNWIFQPENFKYIQNARGTIPVLTTMTSEHTVLPPAVAEFSEETKNATAFAMSFNNITSTVNNDVQTLLNDLYSGNKKADDTVKEIQALWQADPLIK
ncbi:MAG: carbohydrate ABC transporter substrate-binding protein [Clostridiales bacterium]|nr:carbohydrate ABC transporter substrate-binding protein [Clostridiales bacterium]